MYPSSITIPFLCASAHFLNAIYENTFSIQPLNLSSRPHPRNPIYSSIHPLITPFSHHPTLSSIHSLISPSEPEDKTNARIIGEYVISPNCSVFETNLGVYTFELVTAKKVLHVQAPNTKELIEWIDAVREAIVRSYLDTTDPLFQQVVIHSLIYSLIHCHPLSHTLSHCEELFGYYKSFVSTGSDRRS